MARTLMLPAGRMMEYKPKHPDRVTFRTVRASPSSALWGNVEIREWPSVGAMNTALAMQEKAEPGPFRWKRWPS